jgi:hypothetical protein
MLKSINWRLVWQWAIFLMSGLAVFGLLFYSVEYWLVAVLLASQWSLIAEIQRLRKKLRDLGHPADWLSLRK